MLRDIGIANIGQQTSLAVAQSIGSVVTLELDRCSIDNKCSGIVLVGCVPSRILNIGDIGRFG